MVYLDIISLFLRKKKLNDSSTKIKAWFNYFKRTSLLWPFITPAKKILSNLISRCYECIPGLHFYQQTRFDWCKNSDKTSISATPKPAAPVAPPWNGWIPCDWPAANWGWRLPAFTWWLLAQFPSRIWQEKRLSLGIRAPQKVKGSLNKAWKNIFLSSEAFLALTSLPFLPTLKVKSASVKIWKDTSAGPRSLRHAKKWQRGASRLPARLSTSCPNAKSV